jgi:hypothetical protein
MPGAAPQLLKSGRRQSRQIENGKPFADFIGLSGTVLIQPGSAGDRIT